VWGDWVPDMHALRHRKQIRVSPTNHGTTSRIDLSLHVRCTSTLHASYVVPGPTCHKDYARLLNMYRQTNRGYSTVKRLEADITYRAGRHISIAEPWVARK
jgi:hypothetical protein